MRLSVLIQPLHHYINSALLVLGIHLFDFSVGTFVVTVKVAFAAWRVVALHRLLHAYSSSIGDYKRSYQYSPRLCIRLIKYCYFTFSKALCLKCKIVVSELLRVPFVTRLSNILYKNMKKDFANQRALSRAQK